MLNLFSNHTSSLDDYSLSRNPFVTALFHFRDSEKQNQVLQEGGPLPGPESGLCLSLGNELSKERHVLTKQETLLGRGAWAESSRVREPRRTFLPCGLQSLVSWQLG